jgi:hypothetical protein
VQEADLKYEMSITQRGIAASSIGVSVQKVQIMINEEVPDILHYLPHASGINRSHT